MTFFNLNLQKQRRIVCSILFFACFIWPGKTSFGNTIDSLYHELEQVNRLGDRYGVVNVYLQIGEAYFEREEYQKEIDVLEVALDLLKYKPTSKEKFKLYFAIARANQKLNNFEESLELFFKYIESDTSWIEIEKKSEAISRVAMIYQNLGDYDLAYDYQLNALQIQESMNDSLGIGKSLYQIGTIFYYQENITQALEQYRKALKVFEAIKHEKSIYASLAALGSTYEKLGMLDKALDYNLKSLGLSEELNYKAGKAYALTNVAAVYLVQEEFEQANNYLTRSLTLKKELDDKWGQIGTYRTIAEMYIKSGFPEKAMEPLDEGFAISKEIGSRTRMVELLDFYAEAYQKMGQYDKSSAYLRSYIDLRDSLINETTLREMGTQKKRYDVQKRENKIQKLKMANELLEKENEIDSLYSYIWTATAFFLAIVLILIINRYRVQKRSNDLLSEKNHEIFQKNSELQHVNGLINETNQLLEDKNDQIKYQNKRLEESNEDLRNFATVASHDLKEPLRMINSYTKILNKKYKNLFDESANEFMGYIIDGVSRMEGLLNGLLDYSRVSISEDNTKWLNTQDIVDLALGNLRFSIQDKNASVTINAKKLPEIKGNHVQLIQLFQNLIGNAIKFQGKEKPEIILDCGKKGEFFLFTVKDNGIGINEADKIRIFEMFSRLHSKDKYDGTGIGLATCKKIVERHGGEIWVESEPGQGSTFFFTLPAIRKHEEVAV
jgi:signal transduction histidine kinase